MRYLLLGIISCILSIGTIAAGNNDPLLLNDRSEYLIHENFKIYLDASNKLSLSQVINKYQEGQFIDANERNTKIAPFKSYWLRIELINNQPDELMWMLHLNAQISHVWAYSFIEKTINSEPVLTDSSLAVLFYISDNRVLLPAHYGVKNIYYIKLHNILNMPVGISKMYLNSSNGYRQYWLTHGLLVGLVIGGLFVMMLYGLITLIRNPQTLFLYYFLYIFIILVYILLSCFIGNQYIFISNPWFGYKSNIILLIAFFFYFPFIRKMTINKLNTKIDRRLFNPFIIIMFINSSIVSVIAFINEALFKTFMDFTLLIYSVWSIVLVISLWRTNQKLGRVILIGTACLVTGGFFQVLFSILDIIEENHFFNIGVFIELLVFTYVITELQKQKELDLLDSKYKLDNKQRELTQKALHLAQQDEILGSIKNQLLEIKGEKQQTNEAVLNILSNVDMYMKINSWDDFEKYFTEVHPDFYTKLKSIYPDLTQNEVRVCAMLKLNLNTKQIAEVFRKTSKSIEVTRTRIRQKLGLARDENLFDKLSQI